MQIQKRWLGEIRALVLALVWVCQKLLFEQLRKHLVDCKVPQIPHRMVTHSVGQRRIAHWRAVEVGHNPFGQQKVTEERSHHQILPEEPFENGPRQQCPRNGVSNGGEYPVQLAKRRTAVGELAWHNDVSGRVAWEPGVVAFL